jgi:hypothetical protein
MKIFSKKINIAEDDLYWGPNETKENVSNNPINTISSSIIVTAIADDGDGMTDTVPTATIECFIGNSKSNLLSIGTIDLDPTTEADAFYITAPYKYFKLTIETDSTDGFISMENLIRED